GTGSASSYRSMMTELTFVIMVEAATSDEAGWLAGIRLGRITAPGHFITRFRTERVDDEISVPVQRRGCLRDPR
ncbi:hypothetical protein, partial [Amycolatopsis lurida]|uniref:hypothetical protein n=1 Tax=Amycolatopsis lurida TaxID=31959 RepID=UPI003652B8E7